MKQKKELGIKTRAYKGVKAYVAVWRAFLNDAERTTYWYGEGWNLTLTSYFSQNSTQTGSNILLALETDRRKQEKYWGYR